ncbi:glycosyltransferase family 2 protein [Streptomyces sp. CAI-121]|nr:MULTISPECIES: glycosyltransferase family 2 protein [unclassified Streptomyces]NUV69283.1 glycosyltransferase family 2 protein [Streptomyces sp. CAI-121]NUW00927.1 glycosyltransferase family 2 protein [Streptomyces sp. CAI 127]NUW15426.1 glycosyltransferase family 2 protein [Streptomyces sp. CAI-68]
MRGARRPRSAPRRPGAGARPPHPAGLPDAPPRDRDRHDLPPRPCRHRSPCGPSGRRAAGPPILATHDRTRRQLRTTPLEGFPIATDQPSAEPARSFLISVVLPCYNEDQVLRRTHDRLTTALQGLPHEIVYVDDGSTDDTWPLIRQLADAAGPMVRGVRFSRNFGHQAAALAGLAEATGDAVVLMDADLQDPPELIPSMAEQWFKGWSIVSARRTTRHGETRLKKSSAYLYYRLLARLSDQPVALDTGDFRLLDRKVVDFVTSLGEKALFLRGTISWSGFPETDVTYERDARGAGTTKYTLRKMLALSRTGVLSGAGALPLRIPTYLGAASLLGAGAVLACGRARQAAPLAAFGAHSLASGVLGEYLLGVYRQVQGRPTYLVMERTDSNRGTTAEASTPPVKELA